jgi:hypothetical protein
MLVLKKGVLKKILPMFFLAALSLFPLKTEATPTLIGTTVDAELLLPEPYANQEYIAPTSATIGTAAEFYIYSSRGSELFIIDFGESFIRMRLHDNIVSISTAFSRQLHITSIDWYGEPSRYIDGFNLTLGTDWPYSSKLPTGINNSDITFTNDSLTFEWGNGASWSRRNWVQIDLISSEGDPPPPTVPEPSTMLLLGCGLLGLGGFSRRKLKK